MKMLFYLIHIDADLGGETPTLLKSFISYPSHRDVSMSLNISNAEHSEETPS